MNLRIARLVGVFSVVSSGVAGRRRRSPWRRSWRPGPARSLASMTLPDTTITLAQTVPAGGFTQPGARGGGRGGDGGEHAAGVLPRRGHAETVQRLRHQDRGLAAVVELERQAAGGRERRVQRRDRLRGDDDGAAGRLRDHVDRHRATSAAAATSRSATPRRSSTSAIARSTR